ncbi:hypothetical protein LBMAG42_10170 [Deltaproteobacteria bacterium]|nr:hypothetical protein LBMAG42_10170 [Deltaproteobacteria bacterium]
MTLLERVRRAAPPALFARGQLYAQAGGCSRASKDRFLVQVAGRSEGFSVWTDGEDWECSCGAEVAACAHVAAVAIAEKDALLVAPPAAAAGVRYRLRRDPTGLVFDCEIPLGAPRRPEDAELSRILAGQWGKTSLPRGLAQQALGPLRGLDVTLDGAPVRCDPTPVFSMVIVVDEGEGWRVRLVRRGGIDEAFPNGILRMGDTLRPIGEAQIDSGLKQRLVQGVVFEPKEAGRLVTEFLPALRKLVDVEVRSARLPTAQADPPRLAWTVAADGPRLRAQAGIVYGDPVYARVEHGELRRLDARIVPTRDVAAERRLLDGGLPVGAPIEREGFAAVNWIAALPTPAREAILAKAPGFRLVRAGGDPEVDLRTDGDGFRVRVTGDLDPRALVQAWRDHAPLVPLLSGGWRPVPQAWLDRHGAVLAELLDAEEEGGGKLQRHQAGLALQALDELGVEPPPALAALRALAGDFSAIPAASLPAGFVGQLRPYQQRGVDWIHWLRSVGMGGILADDMGLGKTVQCLASLGPGRHLVVAPTSVIGNWARESARFRPDLRVGVYYGAKREMDPKADLVITSWALLRLDAERLSERWTTVLFDEAQAIKNPESQTAEAARAVKAELRLCVTGTPVENRLDELWSGMHVANPGLLGSRRSFRERFSGPIEEGSRSARDGLRRRIRPFILRRNKVDVAPELPSRTDVVLRCTLSERERTLYDAVRSLSSKQAKSLLAGGKGWLQVLEVLLRMRQASCHPGLLPGGDRALGSAKLDLLMETLDEVVAEGHRVLIFSQWTSMLDLVEPALRKAEWGFCRLDGATRDRDAEIARFSAEDGPPIFLLSLKAGGTGLNLTAADYVVHLDPWWNPAVEDQATDRAHRIGQTRPVVSLRLVAEDTVEERILALQERKRELVRAALDEDALAKALTSDELAALFD